MKLLQYYEKDILVFEIESTNRPLLYNQKIYERNGANVDIVEPESYINVFNRLR
ncbi:hypothetical protein D3C72_1056020 [compost metagenome]